MNSIGAVSCGHELTARAAKQILLQGGNAFDAIISAHFMACVCEPILASLGGGGFLTAQTDKQTTVYDFFTQTPINPVNNNSIDFTPIYADFGTTTQEFHIGMGAIATPGSVKGLFTIHDELGTMPMRLLVQPAIEAAKTGVAVNAFQSYLFSVVKPILFNSKQSRQLYQDINKQDCVLPQGSLYRNPALANTLEQLAVEGEQCFYQGDIAKKIIDACQHGGFLTAKDLSQYTVVKRTPLSLRYRNALLLTNPAPSCGGLLLGFALKILASNSLQHWHPSQARYVHLLAEVMRLTNEARVDAENDKHMTHTSLLDPELLAIYHRELENRWRCLNGTTHITVMDSNNNIASMTVSNGEGCGYLLADTGIMLNNMLGEEDVNPSGFFHWPGNQRLASMMAPSILQLDDTTVALGSGGSNRIRTALLQVLVNLVDFNMELNKAIDHPRIHWENDCLNLEPGFECPLEPLKRYGKVKQWQQKNLFFGGVHALSRDKSGIHGAGDSRRAGLCQIVTSGAD